MKNKSPKNLLSLRSRGGGRSNLPKTALSILFAVVFFILTTPLFALSVPAGMFKGIDEDAVGWRSLSQGRSLLLTNRHLFLFEEALPSLACPEQGRRDGRGEGRVIEPYEFGVSETPLRLDVFDLDNDGRKEAVVTSVGAGTGRPASILLDIYDGGPIAMRAGNIPYFFRVVKDGSNFLLLGQKSSDEHPFAGGIHVLRWNGKKFAKEKKIDLPKKTGLYTFADDLSVDDGRVWLREEGGLLRLYEKPVRKWEKTYKTTEKFNGSVKCFPYRKNVPMTTNDWTEACVETPPVVFKEGSADMIFLDRHDFLFAAVLLEPKMPRKAFVDLLKYNDESGLSICTNWGPYQSYIADYGDDGVGTFWVLLNSGGGIKGGVKLIEAKISYLDCKGEF